MCTGITCTHTSWINFSTRNFTKETKMLVFTELLLHLCNILIKKDMKKNEIMEYLLSSDLRARDVVKFSNGLIGLNQASGWVRKLRRGEELSNPVMVMLWKICVERNSLDKPRIDAYMPMGSVGLRDDGLEKLREEFPTHNISLACVDTSEHFLSDSERIRRLELEIKKIGTEMFAIRGRLDSLEKPL